MIVYFLHKFDLAEIIRIPIDGIGINVFHRKILLNLLN
ncbi:hypothetical protein A33Q_4299 [Indibacter alkaliphilus LW1]|uniref:Uncharacterized protein n=1 Tax=Indibacter alkaliphilus (strain CCUG 57479 / KCTC 22604 / LW1) TaxID=1189612 RepID=S2DJP2_INDAL|nr:hypothetical protein A33Q_4299 [Indibacter alkaliphilus LW1]